MTVAPTPSNLPENVVNATSAAQLQKNSANAMKTHGNAESRFASRALSRPCRFSSRSASVK